MEFDLYRNDGSILFTDKTYLQNMDNQTTAVVVSGFGYARSFRQLNSSHVAVVDRSRHCIKMVNREDNSSIALAGICGTSGFVDGASAKFYLPCSIEVDERNPGHLLITEDYNDALRSVDLSSGNVSTVIRTGFNYPRGLTWYNGRLLVCNERYISEVSWSSNGIVTNHKLTSTTAYGYRDGDFFVARFDFPHEIKRIRDDLFIVADSNNNRLRLLNMSTRKVLPVCIGSSASCITGTTLSHYPVSILISDKEVFIGGYKEIHKLTGKLVN